MPSPRKALGAGWTSGPYVNWRIVLTFSGSELRARAPRMSWHKACAVVVGLGPLLVKAASDTPRAITATINNATPRCLIFRTLGCHRTVHKPMVEGPTTTLSERELRAE